MKYVTSNAEAGAESAISGDAACTVVDRDRPVNPRKRQVSEVSQYQRAQGSIFLSRSLRECETVERSVIAHSHLSSDRSIQRQGEVTRRRNDGPIDVWGCSVGFWEDALVELIAWAA